MLVWKRLTLISQMWHRLQSMKSYFFKPESANFFFFILRQKIFVAVAQIVECLPNCDFFLSCLENPTSVQMLGTICSGYMALPPGKECIRASQYDGALLFCQGLLR